MNEPKKSTSSVTECAAADERSSVSEPTTTYDPVLLAHPQLRQFVTEFSLAKECIEAQKYVLDRLSAIFIEYGVGKRFKMNLTTGDLSALSGTDSLPHPGDFPLGSPESRAAARAMIQPDRMRAGDRGTEPDGSWWFVVNNEETGGVTQIIFPKDFSGGMLKWRWMENSR